MEYHELVENELLDQLNKGDYVIASSQPATVSPLAATPNKKKKNTQMTHTQVQNWKKSC